MVNPERLVGDAAICAPTANTVPCNATKALAAPDVAVTLPVKIPADVPTMRTEIVLLRKPLGGGVIVLFETKVVAFVERTNPDGAAKTTEFERA